ncbi:divergent polysaccharide deacetylase family protein [Bacillus timonensis]|nr:divergent polysaccharide deacetylase family protein [Bacillus timonensis]
MVLFLHTPVYANTAVPPENRVAIVIDDFGNKMKGTKQILDLPIPLTVAVMPFLPTTQSDAQLAYEKGHDVIIHLPMEPIKGKRSWLGPGAITSDLSDQEVRKRVNEAIENVPHAVGVNNHMGSKITSDKRIMKVILEVCRERGMFYLDSKTTSKSVVKELATEIGVPYLENELFFDEVYSTQHIIKQANTLLNLVEEDPTVIAIGHVGPPGEMTAAVLKQYIPLLKLKAKPVKLSDLILEKQILE